MINEDRVLDAACPKGLLERQNYARTLAYAQAGDTLAGLEERLARRQVELAALRQAMVADDIDRVAALREISPVPDFPLAIHSPSGAGCARWCDPGTDTAGGYVGWYAG